MNKRIKALLIPMRMDKRFKIKPQSKRDKVVELFKKGWSLTKLANKNNVTIPTITRIVDEVAREENNRRSSRKYRPLDIFEREESQSRFKTSRKERDPRIRRHYAMGLAQNA